MKTSTKRTERVPLSQILHHHHYLLLFAWKIKQGLINNSSSQLLRDYIKYFFNTSLSKHLQQEEEILLKELQENDHARKKLIFSHDTIRGKIEEILNTSAPEPELLESFCKTLIEAVRYEENRFFPYLEEKLDGLQNSWVKYQLAELDEEITDEFQPEFWKP